MVDFLPSKQTVWVRIPLSAFREYNLIGRVCALQAQSYRFKSDYFQKIDGIIQLVE